MSIPFGREDEADTTWTPLIQRSDDYVSIEEIIKQCNDSIMNSSVAGDSRLSETEIAESIHNCISDYNISVRASDQRYPEKVDDSVTVINIVRDQFPPQFVNEPYITSIVDSQALNVGIYQVSAIDPDLPAGDTDTKKKD